MIKRRLEKKIEEKLGDKKAIIVYGPRQVGKTTLLKRIFGEKEGVLWLNGDEEGVRAAFTNFSLQSFLPNIGRNTVLIIDEAQRIEDIGIKLKILQDELGGKLQIIATGSSSFDLANKINEPLTGRKWEFLLLPLSYKEMVAERGAIKEDGALGSRLLYGYYPEVVTHPETARERINEIVLGNLYKDILKLEEIKRPNKLEKLLQALAFQIGAQVSVNELANTVGADNKTVDKYLTLLEQSFIIFRLPSFARNLRSELSASSKYYFYDLGVRNALIDDFRPIELRQDIGGMFENFVISELQKGAERRRQYFWRTTQQQEVDYVYEKDGNIGAVEIKWDSKGKAKLPLTFLESYKPANVDIVDRENVGRFLLEV